MATQAVFVLFWDRGISYMLALVKMGLNSRMTKEAGLYFLANVIKAVLSLVVMPIHTHILSPSQYGLWNIWSSVRTFFEQLVDMGQKSVIQKKFHSDQNFSDVLVSTISLLFLGSTLTFLTLLIVSLFVDSLFGIQMGYYLLIPLFALGTEIFIINTVLLRHENKPLQFCIFQLGYAFGVAFLGIGFVLLFENSWIGLLIGAGATLIILSALCLWQFYKKYNISFVIDKRQMLGLFLVGWPMIFYGINKFRIIKKLIF